MVKEMVVTMLVVGSEDGDGDEMTVMILMVMMMVVMIFSLLVACSTSDRPGYRVGLERSIACHSLDPQLALRYL